MDNNLIFKKIEEIISGNLDTCLSVLSEIEKHMPNIVIIAVDKDKDKIIHGIDYVDEQEFLMENGV